MELWMQVALPLLCLGIGFLAGGYILRLKNQARESSAQAREEQLGKNLEQVGVNFTPSGRICSAFRLKKNY